MSAARCRNAREHGFLLTMVELANFVGAKVIAETVETVEEATMMRELGVEFGQGYYFGRPGDLPGPMSHIPSSMKTEPVA